MSNREIGNKLSLTEGTVKNYVPNVCKKSAQETERRRTART
ncbi:hypothetical protein [Candidatus Villigracilis affinis]|nr:response regulator transcription factor [Anaerolineales bacterium]